MPKLYPKIWDVFNLCVNFYPVSLGFVTHPSSYCNTSNIADFKVARWWQKNDFRIEFFTSCWLYLSPLTTPVKYKIN